MYRTTLLKKRPGLHPAFGPEWLDFILHEGFEIVLHRERALLQLITAQLHTHQVTQQSPGKNNTHAHTHGATRDFLHC